MLSALRERLPPGVSTSSASPVEIALAESRLGLPLPPLLRQVYGVANGGVGPGFGLLRIAEGEDTLVAVYRAFERSGASRRRNAASHLAMALPTAPRRPRRA